MFTHLAWHVVKQVQKDIFDINIGVFAFQFVKANKQINIFMNGNFNR